MLDLKLSLGDKLILSNAQNFVNYII